MIYELYGRLAELLEQERQAHLLTIDVVRRVASGELAPDRLVVTDEQWAIIPLAALALVPPQTDATE